MRTDLQRRLGHGALEGIRVLSWYAFAEYAFIVVSFVLKPMLTHETRQSMLAPQWRGTAILIACYLLAGILAGLVAALFVKQPDHTRGRVRKSLTLAVLLTFALNSAFAVHAASTKTGLITAALLIGAAVFVNFGAIEEEPGLTFGILMCAVWVIASDRLHGLSPLMMALFAAVLVALLVAAAAVFHRVLGWFSAQYSWAGLFKRLAKIGAVAAVTFGVLIPAPEVAGKAQDRAALTVPATPRPNIVLVVLDTVSAGHMGVYGYSRANTPRLEAFSRESTLYRNFKAASPLTLSSHASIFTGLYPQSHGSYTWFDRYQTGRPLAESIPTLAQTLTSAGYRTMAVAANRYYLIAPFGILRGFGIKEWPSPLVVADPSRDYLLRNRVRDLLRIDGVLRDLDNNVMPAEEVNRRALRALDDFQGQDAPFFLFLNYMDAHRPYLPPAPYNRLYPGLDPGFTQKDYSRVEYEVNNLVRPISSREREHLVSQYDGAIAYLDEKMGELIDRLKKNGQFDRTMIVITSDHGEAFGERNIVEHNSSVYEDQVHVPLFIKYAGQTRPERVDIVASHVDLMPTFLNSSGVSLPAGIEGMDLRTPGGFPERVVISEMHGTSESYARFRHSEWALYSGMRKMIYASDGRRALYDLATDPAEEHNLFHTGDPETAQLRARLLEWSRRTTPRFSNLGPADSKVEQRLKSLGYAHQGMN